MPSKKDPNNIETGPGKAASGSITITSLDFSPSGGGGVDSDINASDVSSNPPLKLSGFNVQDHIDGISTVAPQLPNKLGQSSHPKNPSSLQETPSLVQGLYWDGASSEPAQLINQSTLTIDVSFFPADRGVLVASLQDDATGDNPVAALNLQEIFVEGAPDSPTTPSRITGQNNYTAGSLSGGTVDGITQNIDLTDRLPVTTTYGGGAYEAYDEEFTPFQLAKASIQVPLGGSPGKKGEVQIIHFKDKQEYFSWKNGSPYEVFAEVSLNPTDDVYHDDNTSTPVSISTFNFSVDTPNSTSNGRMLSGVEYYDSSDSYTTDWEVNGLFNDSWLEEGVELSWSTNLSGHESLESVKYTIENYASPDPDPANNPTADYPSQSSNFSGDKTRQTHAGLIGQDPFNRSDSQVLTGQDQILYSGANTMTFSAGSSAQTERFEKEEHRYTADTSPEDIDGFVPSGSVDFDNTSALDNDELQVRGSTASQDEYEVVSEGGTLVWPSHDYSSGYVPNTGGQPDYSSLSSAASRSYVRAFDVEGPRRRGRLKILGGEFDGSPLEDAFQYDASNEQYDGHPQGAKIELSTPGTSSSDWSDLFNPDEIFVSIESIIDGFIVTYELDHIPASFSGNYLIGMKISVFDGSNASDPSKFSLQRVEWLRET